MTEVEVKNLYSGISFKPNFDILGIAVSMWNPYDFETIFTYNDTMNT